MEIKATLYCSSVFGPFGMSAPPPQGIRHEQLFMSPATNSSLDGGLEHTRPVPWVFLKHFYAALPFVSAHYHLQSQNVLNFFSFLAS